MSDLSAADARAEAARGVPGPRPVGAARLLAAGGVRDRHRDPPADRRGPRRGRSRSSPTTVGHLDQLAEVPASERETVQRQGRASSRSIDGPSITSDPRRGTGSGHWRVARRMDPSQPRGRPPAHGPPRERLAIFPTNSLGALPCAAMTDRWATFGRVRHADRLGARHRAGHGRGVAGGRRADARSTSSSGSTRSSRRSSRTRRAVPRGAPRRARPPWPPTRTWRSPWGWSSPTPTRCRRGRRSTRCPGCWRS
jgi:hypothetical protein